LAFGDSEALVHELAQALRAATRASSDGTQKMHEPIFTDPSFPPTDASLYRSAATFFTAFGLVCGTCIISY
jgi:hypothetical protein